MMFTLERLTDSIAGVLKETYPEVKVYSNPNQQGTKVPCFFVFFMPTNTRNAMGNRFLREIGIDIVYLTEQNIPDAYDQMIAIADQLDQIMEFVPYVNGGKTQNLRSFDREWKLDDGVLHYQLKIKIFVSVPDDTPRIDEMESYKGGLKDAKNIESVRAI